MFILNISYFSSCFGVRIHWTDLSLSDFYRQCYLFSTFGSASHSSSFSLLPFPFIHSLNFSPLFVFPMVFRLLPFLPLFFFLSLSHLWWWVSVIEPPAVELLSALRVFFQVPNLILKHTYAIAATSFLESL